LFGHEVLTIIHVAVAIQERCGRCAHGALGLAILL